MHVKIVQIVSGVSSVLFKQRQAIVLRRPHEETSQSSSKQRNQERIEVQHTAVVGVMAFSLVHARTAVVVKYGSNTLPIFSTWLKKRKGSAHVLHPATLQTNQTLFGVFRVRVGEQVKSIHARTAMAASPFVINQITHLTHAKLPTSCNQSNHAPYPCQTSRLWCRLEFPPSGSSSTNQW